MERYSVSLSHSYLPSLHLSQLCYIHLYQGISYVHTMSNHNFTVVERCPSAFFFVFLTNFFIIPPKSCL